MTVTENEQRLTVMEMAKKNQYLVKGVSNFKGHDGYGFNATLYRENKKVATIFDDARGGGYYWHWINRIEEKNLDALLKEIQPAYFGEVILEMDTDLFIGYLIDEAEADLKEKRYKRRCKTHTLVTFHDGKEGERLEFKHIYDEEMRSYLQEKYPNGEIKEIINERY